MRYRVDPDGFRADPALPVVPRGQIITVVGDSFCFGLGVNDNQSLVSHLNQAGDQLLVEPVNPGILVRTRSSCCWGELLP